MHALGCDNVHRMVNGNKVPGLFMHVVEPPQLLLVSHAIHWHSHASQPLLNMAVYASHCPGCGYWVTQPPYQEDVAGKVKGTTVSRTARQGAIGAAQA